MPNVSKGLCRMIDVNTCTITGRLARDPETKPVVEDIVCGSLRKVKDDLVC